MYRYVAGILSLLGFLTIVTFLPFFTSKRIPFPGDFQKAWFEPWKNDYTDANGSITLPHKPIADDIFRQLYPFKSFAMSEISNGRAPLWNPYNGSGQPLLATMHVGYLNPFNALFLMLDHRFAWGIQVVLQPLLAALAFFFFLHTVGLKKNAAMFGSLCYFFSPFILVRSLYTDYVFAATLLPLIFGVITKGATSSNKTWLLLIPFLVMFTCFVTQPQIIGYVLLAGLLYVYALGRSKQKVLRMVTTYIVLCIFGLGMASIQLIPTLELYFQSAVTPETSRDIIERFLLSPYHLITVFIPHYFGTQSTYNWWGHGDYVETLAGIGMIPMMFVFFARKSTSKNHPAYYTSLVLVGISILLVLRSPLTLFFYSLPLPLVSTGVPTRLFMLTTFALCALAGIGYEQFYHTSSVLKKKLLPILILCGFICLIPISLYALKIACPVVHIPQCRTIALRNTVLEVIPIVSFWIVAIASTYVRRLHKLSLALPHLMVIALGLYTAQKLLPWSQLDHVMPPHPIITQIQHHGLNRFYSTSPGVLKTDFATHYKIFDPNYYDPLYIKRYGELIAYANGSSTVKRSDVEIVNDAYISKDATFRRNRLLDLLSVSTLLEATSTSDIKWKEHQRPTALPRVYLTSKYSTVADHDLLPKLFDPSFDPTVETLLEQSPLMGGTPANTSTYSAHIQTYAPSYISIEAHSSTPGILVLTDTYFSGWNAYIDNQPTKIYRANYTFKAIELPSGIHRVEFKYEPLSWLVGIIVSILSTSILFVLYSTFRRSILRFF